MNRMIESKDVESLMVNIGYKVQTIDNIQQKIRFSNDYNFVDIWFGKKKIAIGVYNPKTKFIRYESVPYYMPYLEVIEKIIIK